MKPSAAVVLLAAALAALLAPSATGWLFPLPIPLPPLPLFPVPDPFFPPNPFFPFPPAAPVYTPPPPPPPPPSADGCTRFLQGAPLFECNPDLATCCRYLTFLRDTCTQPVFKQPLYASFVRGICANSRTPPPATLS